MLAKSTGEGLIDHSRTVGRFAKRLYEVSVKTHRPLVAEAIRLSALLHDIGKCTKHFQSILKADADEENYKGKGSGYRHNEISWAFLSKHLNVENDLLDMVLDAVYWHHGIDKRNELGGYHDDDVLGKLAQSDIDAMSSFLIEALGDGMLLKEPREESRRAPLHFCDTEFRNNRTYQKTFVRSCLISSDRMASSVRADIGDAGIEVAIKHAMTRLGDLTVTKDTFKGHRFDEQNGIADQASHTTLVKAPAGYGKTNVGLLWAGKSNSRLLWVCPRNMVAESVYDSIRNGLRDMGMEASTELYISGKVQKSDGTGDDGFTADIIVTNIDSFLFPSIKNSVAERQFLIVGCDVVFDEFHELINDNSMFAAFINIMRCRNRMSSGRTILLSATPMNMTFLWDSKEDSTLILPNEDSHYRAAHAKPYEFRITDEVIPEGGANLIISNAIATSQALKKRFNAGMLVHSEFDQRRRLGIFSEIMDEFGKESPRHDRKRNVSSTHILQAAVDVSFMNLFDSVLSPESFLQRLGRCNRWGDNPEGHPPVISCRLDPSPSERTVRQILYDESLVKLWYERLKPLHGRMMTLDECYLMYNQHYRECGDRVKGWLKSRLDTSLKQLKKVYPIQFQSRMRGDKESEVINADSNPLRSNGDQLFFIVKKTDGSGWSDPMTHTMREGFEQDFKEGGETSGNIKRALKEIVDAKDPRFDYEEVLKAINKNGRARKSWAKLSKSSRTPYIRFDEVYDEEYGVISKDNLVKLRSG